MVYSDNMNEQMKEHMRKVYDEELAEVKIKVKKCKAKDLNVKETLAKIVETTSKAAKEADALSIRLQKLTEEIQGDLLKLEQQQETSPRKLTPNEYKEVRWLGYNGHVDVDYIEVAELGTNKKKRIYMDGRIPEETISEDSIEDRYPYGGPYPNADVLGFAVACLLRGAKYWRWDGELIWNQELPEWIDILGIELINDWRKDQRVLEVCWRHPISDEVRTFVMFPGEYLLFDFEPRVLYPEKLEKYFNYIEEQKTELAKYLDDHINGIRVLAETIEEIRKAKRNHE